MAQQTISQASKVTGDDYTAAEHNEVVSVINNNSNDTGDIDARVTVLEGSAGAITTRVVVQTAGDFPTPAGTVITLVAGTVYEIWDDIDIAGNTIVLTDGSHINGQGADISSITTTATGALFTAAAGVSFTLDNFAVTCASGTVFDLNGTGGSIDSAYIRNFTVNSCTGAGTVDDWYSFYWDAGAVVSSTTALTFAGTCSILIINLVEWIVGYTTGIDLGTATFNTCTLFRCGFANASATNHVIIAAAGANMNTDKRGHITFCTFNTGATNIVTNYAVGDVDWDVLDNKGLPSNLKAAQGYLSSTFNTTSIASSTPKLVDLSTLVVDAFSAQFTISTGGRFTYDGLTAATFHVACSLSGTSVSGTNVDYAHYIYKNGVQIAASKTFKEYNNAAVSAPAPAMCLVELEPTDYLELWVENVGGTESWETHVFNMNISEVL